MTIGAVKLSSKATVAMLATSPSMARIAPRPFAGRSILGELDVSAPASV
jgi:hypothetical protein